MQILFRQISIILWLYRSKNSHILLYWGSTQRNSFVFLIFYHLLSKILEVRFLSFNEVWGIFCYNIVIFFLCVLVYFINIHFFWILWCLKAPQLFPENCGYCSARSFIGRVLSCYLDFKLLQFFHFIDFECLFIIWTYFN